MLLLTATRETQGQRPGDFCEAIEGELVVVFSDCHVAAHEDRFRCKEGCPARFFGLNSHQPTTTAKIRPTEISPADYATAIAGYAESRGSPAAETAGYVLADFTVGRAAALLPGTVIGLADGRQYVRASPKPTPGGAAAAAGHFIRVFTWRHHYAERLREIARGVRAKDGQ